MNSIKLSDTVGIKSENLQLTKFIASIMVILSHSFILSTASNEKEWFSILTNDQLTMGSFAVAVFFVCSGYLIPMSLEKSKTAFRFFEARLIRLVPSLFFICLIVMLLCGFISDLSLPEYYTSLETWGYLRNAVFLKQLDLPGVFTHNIYASTINGPLWTLRLEVICYILCFIAYKLKFFDKKLFAITIPLVFGASYFLWTQISIAPTLREILRPVLLFYIGMGFWIYREHIRLHFTGFGIALLACVLLFHYGYGQAAMFLCFPYICIMLWFGLPQCPKKLGILGNYSYVIYLWAFPIQQAVIHFHGGAMDSYKNFFLSTAITILISIPTYHFVEKRFVTWYKRVFHAGR